MPIFPAAGQLPGTALVTLARETKAASQTELRYNLSPEGSKYLKAILLNKGWLQLNEKNLLSLLLTVYWFKYILYLFNR